MSAASIGLAGIKLLRQQHITEMKYLSSFSREVSAILLGSGQKNGSWPMFTDWVGYLAYPSGI